MCFFSFFSIYWYAGNGCRERSHQPIIQQIHVRRDIEHRVISGRGKGHDHRCSCAVTHPSINGFDSDAIMGDNRDMQIHKRSSPELLHNYVRIPPRPQLEPFGNAAVVGWAGHVGRPGAPAGSGTGPVRSPGAILAEPLRRELEQANGPVSFLVILDEQLTPSALAAQAQAASQPAGTARAAIYQALTAHAARTQAPLRAWLDAQGVTLSVLLSGQHAGGERRPGPGRGTARPARRWTGWCATRPRR